MGANAISADSFDAFCYCPRDIRADTMEAAERPHRVRDNLAADPSTLRPYGRPKRSIAYQSILFS
jgi:hypothetical protein